MVTAIQEASMVQFVLPKTFRPFGMLPPELHHRCDEANFLVALIARKWAFGQTDEDGFTHLHSKVLERIIHPTILAPMLRALNQAGVIEIGTHAVGKHSQGYRLTRQYRIDDVRIIPCRDDRLAHRVVKERQRMRGTDEEKWLPIHHVLREMQEGLLAPPTVDTLIPTLRPKPKRRSPEELASATQATRLGQWLNLHSLRNRERFYRVPSGTRAYNYSTGFARPVRKLLLLNDAPIAGVDLVNAQPAMLGMMIALSGGVDCRTYMRGSARPLPLALPCPTLTLPPTLLNSLRDSREFALFCELVKSGRLYECLADECRKADVAIPEGAGSARDWCKRRLLVDFLAKRTFATPEDLRLDKRRKNYGSEIGRVVFSLFPLLYDAVKTINQEDEATLIRLLQAGEAWFIFNQVCDRLVHADVPVLTVHDAIFTAEANVPAVVDAFSEAGREIGFTFRTKRE